MMCSGFSVRVYIPGRCLTGSRPFNTLIDASLYAAFGFFVDMVDSGPTVHRCPQVLWTGPVTMRCVFKKTVTKHRGGWGPPTAGKLFIAGLSPVPRQDRAAGASARSKPVRGVFY